MDALSMVSHGFTSSGDDLSIAAIVTFGMAETLEEAAIGDAKPLGIFVDIPGMFTRLRRMLGRKI